MARGRERFGGGVPKIHMGGTNGGNGTYPRQLLLNRTFGMFGGGNHLESASGRSKSRYTHEYVEFLPARGALIPDRESTAQQSLSALLMREARILDSVQHYRVSGKWHA